MTSSLFVASVSVLSCLVCSAGAAAQQTTPLTTSPSGGYATARLMLSSGLQDSEDKTPPGPQLLFVSLRDNKLANLWFVRPFAGDRRLTVDRSTVAYKGDSLAGTVNLRSAFNRGSPRIGLTLTLQLTIRGEAVTGTYDLAAENAPYKTAKGTVTGTFVTKATAAESLTPPSSWTSFPGSNGDMSANSQPALVGDLAQARPVWKSETYVPTGYGNAPDSRYFIRALVAGNGGGGSSPVVADNTVYMHFYVPSQQSPPSLSGNPFWERTFKSEADFQAKMVELNATGAEAGLVLNHFRPLADDVVVAIDAATGAEKWRTVLPLRSPNLQTHKHRGVSSVPLIVGTTLFVPNLMSRLYALDAKTGALQWETPAFAPHEKPPAVSPPLNPSPLLVGDHLIFTRGTWHSGKITAFDPATGAERWKAPGGFVLRWSREGKEERLITLSGLEKRTLTCLDPVNGKPLWQQETTLSVAAPLSAAIAGDILIAAPPAPRGGPNVVRYEGWRLSETGAAKAWVDTELVVDEHVAITMSGGRGYLLGKQLIRVLDVATGKQELERKFEQQGPGSNAWLGVVGDRLLFSPEGQHGIARLLFMDTQLKDLGPLWLPPNVETTAYNSQPIVYPLVDGRFFVRGGDGIYCYDLRAR